MATALDLIQNLKSLDIGSIASTITEKNEKHITSAVKSQLWDGQKPDGSDITPSYLDDPFFKTRKQAEGYANWKMKLSKNSKRNKYAPNLYINGYFYGTIMVKMNKEKFEVGSTWSEVGSKYKDALGLSVEHGSEIVEEYIRPEWEVMVEKLTGLKFK